MELALCYDRGNRRLFKGDSNSNDCIFTEHDKKGYKTYKFVIPDEPVEITVFSNLHYQGASFLYAKILVKDKLVLNFHDKESLYLISHNGLETFQVQAGDWNELFNIIIKIHDNLYFINQCKNNSLLANNNLFSQKLLMSCRNYLQRFSGCFSQLQFKENDSRVERLSKELLLICDYVGRNGKPLEFAKLLIQ